MTETLTTAKAPSIDSGKKVVFRTKRSSFGDGYTQRAGDGINTRLRKFSVTWNLLSLSEIESIESFLEAREGHEAFFWTPPRETTPRKYICEGYDRGYTGGIADSLTATFEEVFDL